MEIPSKTIFLPKNAKIQKQLSSKLSKHWSSLYPDGEAVKKQQEIIYEIALLSKLLTDGQVNTDETMRHLLEIYGVSFHLGLYYDACISVSKYLEEN